MNKTNLLKALTVQFTQNHFRRRIGTSSIRLKNIDKPQEIRIDVPWGRIAGKWYGSQNVRPIMLIHGWQDNAGTFDNLVPLLPKNRSYLAIDLPGHGFSSRIPDGMFYSVQHGLHVVNLIRNHFEWEKVSFCSHSMGAQISVLYASIFPEQCDLVVCIDGLLKPDHGSHENQIELLRLLGDPFLLVDERNQRKSEPPAYTYNEIIDLWVKSTNGSVTKETVPLLMKRAIAPSRKDTNRFYFTRDFRLKYQDFGHFSDEMYFALIKRITAPHLFIKAKNSPYFEGKEKCLKTIEFLTKSNPKFEWFTINAAHHLHLTDAELFSDELSRFIEKHPPHE